MSDSDSPPTPDTTTDDDHIDTASQLVGKLNSNGVASLQVDTSRPSTRHAPANSKAIPIVTGEHKKADIESDSSSVESIEDYDKLQQDPLTVVSKARDGQHDDAPPSKRPRLLDVDTTYEDIKPARTNGAAKRSRPGPMRMTSIPVTLKKSGTEGKYFLMADDLELKSILKMGAEREGLAKKGRRTKFSDILFTRQFTAFDRLNEESGESPFHGFFNLFWLGVAIFVVQTATNNYLEHGHIMGTNEIQQMMFKRDLIVLGLSDGVMCAATGFGWVLQVLIARGWLTWNGMGWLIQSIWETLFLTGVVYWTLFREWPWSHTVFFVLHGIVMLMKQHSYAFYNGYLSEAVPVRQKLMKRMKQLDAIEPSATPGPTTPSVASLNTSYLDHRPNAQELSERRHMTPAKASTNSSTDISQIAKAVESQEPLDMEQIMLFERIMRWEIDALTEELKGKASDESAVYPKNLTMSNHYEYIVLPTLVYELGYPRTERRNWSYVFEKSIATFGVLFIMQLVSQTFIFPVVVRTHAMRDAGLTLVQRLHHFPGILSTLIFPFMMEYLMAWYVIWECILNLLAELTLFADRGFYDAWWNSVSWDQFARDWNRPVHNFLLRHVYHSSISSLKVHKTTATLMTFFLSAVVHELVMWCLFKKLRGYLLVLQLCQLPLVSLSRTKFLRGHATLGNLQFWVGIFLGPSLLCSLYLII